MKLTLKKEVVRDLAVRTSVRTGAFQRFVSVAIACNPPLQAGGIVSLPQGGACLSVNGGCKGGDLAKMDGV